MSALGRVVRAGVGRRRAQTLITVVTTLISVTAAILAAGLLVASSAPFDSAFARQHGAQLAAQFDGAAVSAAQLDGTADAAGVTAAAGPFPTATVRARAGEGSELVPAGLDLGPLTVVGRARPGGPVDALTLLDGHWPTGPGQLVVSTDAPFPAGVGASVELPDLPGSPTLEVVGVAASVTGTADAWATPGQVSALGAAPGHQMLYRFDRAATQAQVDADRRAIAAAVPAGALTGSQSWLAVRQLAVANTAAFVPFLVAFGILGLALSVLIIGVVVGGAVGAATRRIGVLKSLGFTPVQVVRAYVGQALIPAAIGVVLGVVLGNLLAVPVLHGSDTIAGAPAVSIPAWVDVAVVAGTLAAVAGVALVPALGAGRLGTVEAITAGRTPGAGRGRMPGGRTLRLPLSRPVALGLGAVIARPGRAAATALAVLLGAVAVTFAVGLTLSLAAVQAGRDPDASGAVVVTGGGSPLGAITVPAPGQTADPFDAVAVANAIAEHPGTRRFYGASEERLRVSGIVGTTPVIGYSGDTSWATHQMVAGHWLSGPGQAVVGTRFLTAAGRHVGDTLILTDDEGRTTTVRIVGEVFELSRDGMDVFTDASTFTGLVADASPARFSVDLDPGTDVQAYVDSLQTVLGPLGAGTMANPGGGSDVIAAMTALVTTFTLLLVAVAALGVFNTVLLDTRERAHDLGVLKAVGMTPRQTVAMVLTGVTGIGLLAGVVGVPLGLVLHHSVVPIMGGIAGTTLSTEDVAVYGAPVLALLVLGGVAIAVAGALAPASWAAGKRAQVALRTE